MADVDIHSGLPIRSEVDSADERVQSKIVGAASATLGAAAGYQLQVDSDGNAHAEVHGHKAGGTTDVVLKLSGNGDVTPDGFYDVTNNADPANTGLVGLVRNNTPADSQQTLRITAKANTDGTAGEVRSLDMALHDGAGNLFSLSNPLPVDTSASGGTPVADEKTEP